MLAKAKILLVGCGSMGAAMIKGWCNEGVGDKVYTIVAPQESSVMSLRAFCDINWYATPEEVPSDYVPDFVILAVKPQKMDQVVRSYYDYALKGSIVVTVAAGLKLDWYHTYLGDNVKLIRVMPNLPVAYNKGMTFGYASKTIEGLDLSVTHALFSSLGKMLWLANEDLFDASALLSGCGPAYLYLLVEALTQAGVNAGLAPEASEILARQAMIGAATLLDHSTDHAQILKRKVASPGGVTEAALTVLENPENGLPILLNNAVIAGVKRSKELANA